MTADRGPLQIGQRFAGCTVKRLLGAGASSAVYAAFDDNAGEWRALKVFLPTPDGGSAQAEGRRRFGLEPGLAARLQHPDIVRVFASGQTDGLAWLSMELLAGTDLDRYTQPTRRLPEAVVLQVAERIAHALAHAHQLGIVHRDLKPANVMVDWATQRVTLTDLGLARSDDAEATRTGLVLGSPAYMAPELLAGATPDARSDLYALGVLLYQLLSGRLPFDASGLGELLRQVATTPAPDLRTWLPALDAGVAELVQLLLAKRPADRPADAAAVAKRLGALQAAVTPLAAGPEADGAKSRR
jgi:eukaryotic-like serine/threonine-protein kinase